MIELNRVLKRDIAAHAAVCFPHECCGLIVNGDYWPCENVSTDPAGQFEIDPKTFAKMEEHGNIEAIVHSHPNGVALASELDKHQIELHGLPWVICAYPDVSFEVYQPTGYQAPLIGRNYHHGWQDCYTLVQDFYSRELGITLPHFERDDAWWERKDSPSLYLDNYAKVGFVEVEFAQMQRGDMLLCRVGRTEHPNHALIFLGDDGTLTTESTAPCIGAALMLHHPYGRKSCREIYGPQWAERTVKVLRHNLLIQQQTGASC